MDDLKGLAEVVDRLVYEALGLVVPGAALIIAGMFVLGIDAAWAATAAGEHPWLAAGACWVVGLALQGASAPITVAADFLFTLPARPFIRPKPPAVADPKQADLRVVATEYWRKQLGLAPAQTLRWQDVRDLSYSVITSAQGRLARFRALASGTRALAAVAALVVVGSIVFPAITVRSVPPGWLIVSAVALVSYFALMERSRMYNQLWDDIIAPLFLATVMVDKTAAASVDGRV
jgi:hypothetical protein